MTPKIDLTETAARYGERQLVLFDQKNAGQKEAAGLTSDLRSLYGPTIFSITLQAALDRRFNRTKSVLFK